MQWLVLGAAARRELDQCLFARAVEQNGFAEDLGNGGAGRPRQFISNRAAVGQAAFLELDLDQFVGLQGFIHRGNDISGDFLATDHDDRLEFMAEAAQKAGLFAGQRFWLDCIHVDTFIAVWFADNPKKAF